MSEQQLPAVQEEQQNALAAYSNTQVGILKNVVCKEASDMEISFFLQVCAAKRLDPFGQQIFLVKRKGYNGKPDSLTIQTGIDGFRATAAKTGEYAGNDEPKFEYAPDKGKKPTKATVTVWRLVNGQRVSFTASARWDEFYPGEKMGFMWDSKPHVMLGKCAEAQALRRAFPNECGGLYEQAELQRDDEETAGAIRVSSAQEANSRFLPPKGAPSPDDQPANHDQLMRMVDAFEKLGVDGDAVANYLGISRESVPTKAHIIKLHAWYEQLMQERAGARNVVGGGQ